MNIRTLPMITNQKQMQIMRTQEPQLVSFMHCNWIISRHTKSMKNCILPMLEQSASWKVACWPTTSQHAPQLANMTIFGSIILKLFTYFRQFNIEVMVRIFCSLQIHLKRHIRKSRYAIPSPFDCQSTIGGFRLLSHVIHITLHNLQQSSMKLTAAEKYQRSVMRSFQPWVGWGAESPTSHAYSFAWQCGV